jgi:dolichyl-phosphate-mannose--protein O-mannosyl transferase
MDLLWSIVSVVIVALIVLIGILFVWRIIKDRRSGYPSGDERTQRITGKAAIYAIDIGLYFMIALLAVFIIGRELLGYYLFNAGDALVASVLVQSVTMLVLRWYLDRKGD